MSRIRADRYTNRLGTGAPLFANGVNVTGNVGVGTTVPTSKLSVIGDMNVTGTVSVGGTLTYEDVTSIDAVGIITAQSGIHLDDSIVHLGDTNTKIRFPAADTITAETAGSERVHITSAGDVGINCTPHSNAGINLHIHGDNTTSEIRLTNTTTGTGNNGSYIQQSGNTLYIGNSESGNVVVENNGAERLRVENNGNVSINWGNPLTWPKVTIRDAGSTISSGNAINGSSMKGIHLANSNNDDTSLGLWATTGDAHWSGISFQRNNSASTWGTDIRFYTHEDATNDLTYARERLRIDPGGRVTMPYQPCFWATSNSGSTDTGEGYTGIFSNQLEQANVNIGNHYNTSTGVFTCPVAGTYEFHGQGLIRYQGGTGRAELTFYKNGSNTVNRSYGYTYITTTNDHDNLHVMGYITCAKNDQIDLRVYAMDSGIDCYFAEGLGYFAGRLVQ
jgi:hypothetical protein